MCNTLSILILQVPNYCISFNCIIIHLPYINPLPLSPVKGSCTHTHTHSYMYTHIVTSRLLSLNKILIRVASGSPLHPHSLHLPNWSYSSTICRPIIASIMSSNVIIPENVKGKHELLSFSNDNNNSTLLITKQVKTSFLLKELAGETDN